MSAGTILMILLLAGAVLGMRSASAGAAWGKPLGISCAVLAIVLAIALGATRGRREHRSDLHALLNPHYRAGEMLGQHLAERFPRARAVFLQRPTAGGDPLSPIETEAVRGLRDGLGSMVEIVKEIALRPPPNLIRKLEQEATELGLEDPVDIKIHVNSELGYYQAWFSRKVLLHLLREQGEGADLLITAAGLPRNLAGMAEPQQQRLPSIAVLNGEIADPEGLLNAGILDAAIVPRTNARSGNPDTAGEDPFLLLTPPGTEASP